jgi:DTW domain-containing protein YfiP
MIIAVAVRNDETKSTSETHWSVINGKLLFNNSRADPGVMLRRALSTSTRTATPMAAAASSNLMTTAPALSTVAVPAPPPVIAAPASIRRGRGRASGVSGSDLLCPDAASAAALEDRIRPWLTPPEAALVDGGVMRRIRRRRRRILCRDEMQALLAATCTPQERHEAVVAFTMLTRRLSILDKGYCTKCLYFAPRCICNAITQVKTKHTLYLFQHVGEFARQNNSGHLLCMILGAKSATQGIRCEVDAMMAHADEHRDSSVVLFPSPDAITMQAYQAQRAERLGAEAAAAKPLTLFLPDGTSNQARNLERHLPSYLPRIRINGGSMRSWLDPLRRQTESHRVCTAQAAALVLAELDEHEPLIYVKEAVDTVVKLTESERAGVSSKPSIWPTSAKKVEAELAPAVAPS